MSSELVDLSGKLLKIWCDKLLTLQIRQSLSPGLDGGILCPACARIHGRCMDAMYPFMHLANATGDDTYKQAALQLFVWQRNVSRADGAWYNDVAVDLWTGITAYGAVALGEALRRHGDALTAPESRPWTDRLRAAAQFLYNTFSIDTGNINYPATAAYALCLAGKLLEHPDFPAKGRTLARECLEFISPANGLIAGEGKPIGSRSAKGCPPIDLGYNVEETLGSLAMYGVLAQDGVVLDRVAASMHAHLDFLLPDGAWDNSWGTRSYKWTYWGSRTCDGCQTSYGLLADRDPVFYQAALTNLKLLEQCTHDGLLHGGPHYHTHGVLPCVHHTFCHAKALAMLLDSQVGEVAPAEPVSLPRRVACGVKCVAETDTYLISHEKWRATVAGYDWDAKQDGHATGGALSLLWHEDAGPILAAGTNRYFLREPSNMQVNFDEVVMALTPRIECCIDGRMYTNINDQNAIITRHQTQSGWELHVLARLVDIDWLHPPEGEIAVQCLYQFNDSFTCIYKRSELFAPPMPFDIYIPLLSPRHESFEFDADTTLRLEKQSSRLTLKTDVPMKIVACRHDRIFSHVGGFEAIPVHLSWPVAQQDTCSYEITLQK
ncbi:MAG: hypothetical protein GF398_06650 [Chitinivibrionales bacterium]|nr:hypothetical protein [Chitinivibrionales bacterium]